MTEDARSGSTSICLADKVKKDRSNEDPAQVHNGNVLAAQDHVALKTSARCDPVTMPTNGYVNRMGGGWTCHIGFRAVDETCAAIFVPENACVTNSPYGGGWECRYGDRPSGERCELFEVPDNAHSNYSGDDWDCNKPYRKRMESSVSPETP
jgi:hypothetical protein